MAERSKRKEIFYRATRNQTFINHLSCAIGILDDPCDIQTQPKGYPMAIHDVDPTTLVLRAAEVLEKNKAVEPLAWSHFAKTGMSKDRPPAQANWWFIRSAAILRKLYLKGPIGTEKLRTYFGGKKNRGAKPEHFFAAGGNHIRKILQQLEKAGLVRKTEIEGHKGRVITPKGQQLLESVAVQFAAPVPKAQPKAESASKTETEPKKKKTTKKKAKEDGKE